jgi:hypothetical protein
VRFIDEPAVRARLRSAEVFGLTQEYLAQREWDDAPFADESASPPPVKIGYHRGRPVAYRLRLDDAPPRYVTVLGEHGRPPAAVAATYLTYQRTAALLLTGPWQAAGRRVGSVLVVGAGRLGRSTAALAGELFTGARVMLYERSARRPGRTPTGVELISSCATDSRFDVVITATSSASSLVDDVPLHLARWLVVGGSARTGAEVRGVPLGGRRQYADNPLNARARGLLDDPVRLAASPGRLADEPSVVFVCGGGGVDGYLAAECLRRNSMERP